MTVYNINKEQRARIGFALVLVALLIIFGGLIYHQIIRHSYFVEQSENNRIRVQPIIPKRGLIYDRNMQVIADNRLSYTVSIVPFESIDGVTIPRLAGLLDMDTLTIEKRAKANYISRYIPAPIKRGQGIEIVSVLEERDHDYPGITYGVESVRQYAQDISAESFIGYVGEISEEELAAGTYKDARPGSLVGKKGIEKTYDRLLRGLEGTEYIEVSARGRIVGRSMARERIAPVPGSDLILTIDKDLQQFIVANFDSVQCCGAVIVIDPGSGEVLGMASFPHFDPNIFSGVISPEAWQLVVADPNHPLLNRPMAGLYPPGSTAKLLTAGAALETNSITEEYLLKPCLGGMQFGNRFFRCWDSRGHGRLNVFHAIEQSCDVYFYQVGQLLGVNVWSEYAHKCGFGRKTDIDIPGELSGIVPSTNYYDSIYGPRNWSPYLVLNLAIGQGEFTVTPLQLGQFFCGLACDGKVYRPHLLKSIIHPDGTIEEIKPVLSFMLPFSHRTLDILDRSLDLVVNGDRGTARGLRRSHFRIGGKTGTAQNPHGEDHSWFVGMAPAESPQIVVVGLVENAGHGSEVAAPLVGKIIDHYLSSIAVAPVAKADEAGIK
jgi:penicillin-binding protein 2